MTKPTFNTGDVPSASQVNDWFVNVGYVRKAVTESVTSSTTLQNDDELVLAVAANATYELTLVLRYDAATAGDLRVSIIGPAGYSFGAMLIRLHPAATSTADASHVYIIGGGVDALGGLGASVDAPALIQGLMITSSTAGNCQFQWAQDVSNATASRIWAGSYMKLLRVA